MNGIDVQGLTKRYGDVCALDGVSLRWEENKIYGLLGRNGAGKTTLLNLIANRLFADEGTVTVDGRRAVENDAAQRDIFLAGEQMYHPERMRVSEAFGWAKAFYPGFDDAYARHLCQLFALPENKRIRALSTGYQSIFKVIVALSVNARYMLLDEPALGLDAHHRELLYRLLIEKFSEHPCTIVVSTHLIDEIAGLLEHVVMLKAGKVVADENCQQLLDSGYAVSGRAQAVDDYTAGRTVIGVETLGGFKTAYLLGRCAGEALPEGLEASRMDLQKLFIQMTA